MGLMYSQKNLSKLTSIIGAITGIICRVSTWLWKIMQGTFGPVMIIMK